jgi:hypothetical protein
MDADWFRPTAAPWNGWPAGPRREAEIYQFIQGEQSQNHGEEENARNAGLRSCFLSVYRDVPAHRGAGGTAALA